MKIQRQSEQFAYRVAMPAPLPKGVTFHYHDTDTTEAPFIFAPAIEARHNGNHVGKLEWFSDHETNPHWNHGEINMIEVHPDYQRQSIATAMFDHARQIDPAVKHSPGKTNMGKAWAEYEQSRHAYRIAMPAPLPNDVTFHYHPDDTDVPVLDYGWPYEYPEGTRPQWVYRGHPGHRERAQGAFTTPAVEARVDGKHAGYLSWDPESKKISQIQVFKPHQRQSIGTSLWDFAKQHEPDLQHSRNLTPSGEQWSQHERSRSEPDLERHPREVDPDSGNYRTAATPEEARDEAVTPDNRSDFKQPWTPDMTVPASPDGPWYHSTYADLKPGDKILPLGQSPEDRPVDASGRPAESKYEWGSKPGMTNRNNFVWMYQDPLSAYDWFQKYKRKKRNGPRGKLYAIKPDDTPQRWNNGVDGEHVSHSATVIGELDPEALQVAMRGSIGGFGDPYHRERSKDPDSEIIRDFYPEPPIAIPDDPYNRWHQKGYSEWSAKGWGSEHYNDPDVQKAAAAIHYASRLLTSTTDNWHGTCYWCNDFNEGPLSWAALQKLRLQHAHDTGGVGDEGEGGHATVVYDGPPPQRGGKTAAVFSNGRWYTGYKQVGLFDMPTDTVHYYRFNDGVTGHEKDDDYRRIGKPTLRLVRIQRQRDAFAYRIAAEDTTTVWHYTTPDTAAKILSNGFVYQDDPQHRDSGGFDGDTYRPPGTKGVERPLWFVDNTFGMAPSELSMGRPGTDYRMLQVDVPTRAMMEEQEGQGRGWWVVPEKALRGRPVTDVTDDYYPDSHRTAARLAALTQDIVDGLDNEFHDWYADVGRHSDEVSPQPQPVSNWRNVERFLKDKYPAAHRGLDMGYEEARPLLDGGTLPKYVLDYRRVNKMNPNISDDPYETGPNAQTVYGYDPREVAAGMLLLHNHSNPFRGNMAEDDQQRLVDIVKKRHTMQQDYERRQTAGIQDRHTFRHTASLNDDWDNFTSQQVEPSTETTTLHRGVGFSKGELPPDLEQRVEAAKAGNPDPTLAGDLITHMGRGTQGLGGFWTHGKDGPWLAEGYSLRTQHGPSDNNPADHSVVMSGDWDGNNGEWDFADDPDYRKLRPGTPLHVHTVRLHTPKGWVELGGDSEGTNRYARYLNSHR